MSNQTVAGVAQDLEHLGPYQGWPFCVTRASQQGRGAMMMNGVWSPDNRLFGTREGGQALVRTRGEPTADVATISQVCGGVLSTSALSDLQQSEPAAFQKAAESCNVKGRKLKISFKFRC